jgi:uncharacterized coiled-coil protein SlyX
MRLNKRGSLTLIFFLTFTLLIGCSSEVEQSSKVANPNMAFNSTESAQTDSMAKPQSGLHPTSASDKLPPTPQVTKKMIYTAKINVTVKDYKTAKTKLEELVQQHDGYMVNSSEKSNKAIRGNFTFRIPQTEFDPFIKDIPKLTDSAPPSIEIDGNDVSEEMVDLESRLKAKQAMENRLLDFMKKASKTEDLLDISNQLNLTQEQIEQIKGRLNYLNNKVDFSTVHISMEQTVVSPTPPDQSLGKQMVESFLVSISRLGAFGESLLIFLSGAIPVLLVLGVIGVPIYLLMRRFSRKTHNRDASSGPDGN